jgi:hypothetical protein
LSNDSLQNNQQNFCSFQQVLGVARGLRVRVIKNSAKHIFLILFRTSKLAQMKYRYRQTGFI